MKNKTPSFMNIESGKFIYGREVVGALCEMEHANKLSTCVAGVILTRERSIEEEDGSTIVLIKVVM